MFLGPQDISFILSLPNSKEGGYFLFVFWGVSN